MEIIKIFVSNYDSSVVANIMSSDKVFIVGGRSFM
jgi:hypothetical protein